MNSLFCVGMEVQQSGHKVLDKAQRLTHHIPGFELEQHERKTLFLITHIYTVLHGLLALMAVGLWRGKLNLKTICPTLWKL